jgi:hypothetical protein
MADGVVRLAAILTFPTSLMRKWVYLRLSAVKAIAASLRIARGVRAIRDARRARAVLPSASCVLVPPVPLHKKGAGGMLRADLLAQNFPIYVLAIRFLTGTKQMALRPANAGVWRA